MKARIKETGEVVSIIKDNHNDEYYVARKKNGMTIIIHNSEIDLLNTAYIDWERRRYEIAKEAMGALISSPSYQYCVSSNYYGDTHSRPWSVAEIAVEYSDALIEELKKG